MAGASRAFGTQGRQARLARIRGLLIAAAVVIALASPVAVLLGLAGVRAHWFDYRIGLGVLTGRLAPFLALLGLVLGLIGLALALLVSPRRGLIGALVAIAVGALGSAAFAQLRASAARSPPVHDVATDWRDPLLPSARLLAARGEQANPIEAAPVVQGPGNARALLGRPVAEVNAATCPGATPVTLAEPPVRAWDAVRAVLLRDRLMLVTEDKPGGRLEATSRADAFGLHDDLIVRVRSEGAGARIDLRSISRVGLSDLGANCRRITDLRRALAR